MHVQNCEVITGSVLGAAITVSTAVRMRANRFTRRAARLCGTVALAGWAISGLTGFDSPRIEKTNLALIEDQRAASLSAKTESVSANTESVDAPQLAAINKIGTSDADMVMTAPGATGSDRSESIVETAVAHPSQKLPVETPSVQMATRSVPDAVHT